MWDSLAAAYLLDPDFVTKSETRYLDVQTAWGQFYGSTVPLDRRVAPDATPVTVMLGLDFKRVFALYIREAYPSGIDRANRRGAKQGAHVEQVRSSSRNTGARSTSHLLPGLRGRKAGDPAGRVCTAAGPPGSIH